MRLATLNDGTPDGRLVVVSPDANSCAAAPVKTLQEALERWDELLPQLRAIADFPDPLDMAQVTAPLPRAWQWLDGSVYASHGALMDKVIGVDKPPVDWPLMYQGVSSKFYGPTEDVVMADEALGIDFEGEFGVLTTRVPMGTTAQDAGAHIALVVQINDWSLRTLAGPEMKTGFGWVQAKPPCSMAPFAVTPDELGDGWEDFQPNMHLRVHWNGEQFGDAHGKAMGYGFDKLVAHAARTRELVAGTVIGSGTVSNENYREVGSSCIAERRGIEIVDEGAPRTEFMRFGDSVRMEARTTDGRTPFGAIEQRVVSL
ncbi:fumarylacetoacetate hydrolase [Erythrobacter arachoides]|uniref:Fumarylacetoacetate hydrolase n=1 Tax=Aurantiacibacter arachoides TaxID=1850444 RepID=A0A844ZY18_9SPHN|nr:fumarylacetoacetate hydrolase family protein [Aurantiacibacter arachoides]MXO92618.1 fumarylacetoacetate hydrolase [Aurantiacibacter arachoides]GGD55743.1 2-keto-4-pentenoate hydratase [Aurantiacibacter arachoides]